MIQFSNLKRVVSLMSIRNTKKLMIARFDEVEWNNTSFFLVYIICFVLISFYSLLPNHIQQTIFAGHEVACYFVVGLMFLIGLIYFFYGICFILETVEESVMNWVIYCFSFLFLILLPLIPILIIDNFMMIIPASLNVILAWEIFILKKRV
jgi:hypothetical protein